MEEPLLKIRGRDIFPEEVDPMFWSAVKMCLVALLVFALGMAIPTLFQK